MDKKTLGGLIVIIAFIGVLIWFGSGSGTETGSESSLPVGQLAAALKAGEESFDFGEISMAKGKVVHDFKVKNEGTKPVTIKKIYTSCMCTEASLKIEAKTFGPFGMQGHGFAPTIEASMPAGGEGEVTAVFDPAAHGPAGIGRIERLIVLESSSNNAISFKIAATVTP